MWAVIGTILTTALPLLLKLVLFIIDKKADNQKLKEEFLKFVSEIETDLPIKMHDKYEGQLERLRERLKKESGK